MQREKGLNWSQINQRKSTGEQEDLCFFACMLVLEQE